MELNLSWSRAQNPCGCGVIAFGSWFGEIPAFQDYMRFLKTLQHEVVVSIKQYGYDFLNQQYCNMNNPLHKIMPYPSHQAHVMQQRAKLKSRIFNDHHVV
eukprot:5911637-Amphidinium_carterae.1